MADEKGLAGFKKSEFVDPARVLGDDVRAEDLPSGVRAYMREKSLNLGGKKAIINAYRLVDEGGLKYRRQWSAKLDDNRVPEDFEIAERCGGGKFIWIMKWEGQDGRESGIVSETIDIDEASGRAMHEAWKRRQAPADSIPAGSSAAVPAAPAAPPGAFDLANILSIMTASEEKTLRMMERMAAITSGQRSDTPAEVLKSAYEGASDIMSKAVETNLQMVNAVRKNQVARMEREAKEDDPAPADDGEGEDGPQMPAWLAPFIPQIKPWLEKLLAGGPLGAAAKTLILSSEEWKGIFNDPERWGQAVSAMEREFGTERTSGALDVLLNRRKDKPKAQKGKGRA